MHYADEAEIHGRGDHSPFGGGSVNESTVYNKKYYGLWAGSQSSTIVLFQDGRMRSNLNDWTQRSNYSIRKVHAQNYDIFSEPLLDYLNLSCCRQISASLYGPSKLENWPKIELLIPAQ